MTFTPVMDLRAAGKFVEQACWLAEPHRREIPGLSYYLNQLEDVARGLRIVSNNASATEREKALSLFA